ncbi:hypothetical protein BGZ63DRAFT_429239 [Mariannaea sp. PMI_226]|nr:hypothetical protein BGZ63DRAFT_429239 [Mariannaea sp. PMI_226]
MASQTETGAVRTGQFTPPLALSDIHNITINSAPGVTLSDQERLLVGSILDVGPSRGNPIRLNLSNKYILRGIKVERTIDSEIQIHLDKDGQVETLEEHWVTVRNEGAQPAQGPQELGPWGTLWWVWIRMSDWYWWTLCTDTYWWASWPRRRASGFFVTECTRAVKSVEDWDFGPKSDQKKNI